MFILWFFGILAAIYLIGCVIGAHDDARVRAAQAPLVLVPDEHGIYRAIKQTHGAQDAADEISTYELQPVSKGTIHGRLFLVCFVVWAFCAFMWFATGTTTPEGQWMGNGAWFIFGIPPFCLGALIGVGSWVLTGRPW